MRSVLNPINQSTGYLASGSLVIDHWEPITGSESLIVKLCVKYSSMHVCVCVRAFLILLNVNNNGWFLPQDTSESLKLFYLRVKWGWLCGESRHPLQITRHKKTGGVYREKWLKMINTTIRAVFLRIYDHGMSIRFRRSDFFLPKLNSDLI